MSQFSIEKPGRNAEENPLITIRDPDHTMLPHPVLIWFPGSDFRGDDTNKAEDPRCPLNALLADGFSIVHVHFQRRRKSIFPIPIDIAAEVISWIADRSVEMNWDKSRLLLSGFGLGGSMAALLPKYLRDHGLLLSKGIRIIGLVLYMSPTRFFVLPNSSTSNTLLNPLWVYRSRHPARSLLNLLQPTPDLSAVNDSAENAVFDGYPPTLVLRGGATFRGFIHPYLPFVNKVNEVGSRVRLGIVVDAGNSAHAVGGLDLVRSFLFEKKIANSSKAAKCPDLFVLLKHKRESTWERCELYSYNYHRYDWMLSFKRWREPLQYYPSRPILLDEFKSRALGQMVSTYVYLPPSYKREDARRYPTVYLLIPHFHQPRQAGTYDYLGPIDVAIRSGGMPEAIYVIPNHLNRNFSSFRHAQLQSFLSGLGILCAVDRMIAHELVSFIDSKYRTIADSRYRAIMSECASASMAFQIGINSKNIFGYIDLGAAFYERAYRLSTFRASRRKDKRQQITILQGGNAPKKEVVGAHNLHSFLEAHGLPCRYAEFANGGHGLVPIVQFADSPDPFGHFDRWPESRNRPTSPNTAVAGMKIDRYEELDIVKASGSVRGPQRLVIYIPSGNYLADFWKTPMYEPHSLRPLLQMNFTIAVIKLKSIINRSGKHLLDDCLAGIKQLVQLAPALELDLTQIGLFGVGGGAYLAGLLVSDALEEVYTSEELRDYKTFRPHIAALCLCSCPADLPFLDYTNWRDSSVACHEQAFSPSSIDRFLSNLFPVSSEAKVWTWDLSKRIDFHGPINLIHGAEDPIVSPRQTAALHARLSERGADVSLTLIEHHGHGDANENVQKAVASFFASPRSIRSYPEDLVTTGYGTFFCASRNVDPFSRTIPSIEYVVIHKGTPEAFSCHIYQPQFIDVPKRDLPILYVLCGQKETGRDYFTFVEYYDEAVKAHDAPPAIVVIINPVALMRNRQFNLQAFLAAEEAVERHLGTPQNVSRILECFSNAVNLGVAVGTQNQSRHTGISLVILNQADVNVDSDSQERLNALELPNQSIRWRVVRSQQKNSDSNDFILRLRKHATVNEIDVGPCEDLINFLEAKENPFGFYFHVLGTIVAAKNK